MSKVVPVSDILRHRFRYWNRVVDVTGFLIVELQLGEDEETGVAKHTAFLATLDDETRHILVTGEHIDALKARKMLQVKQRHLLDRLFTHYGSRSWLGTLHVYKFPAILRGTLRMEPSLPFRLSLVDLSSLTLLARQDGYYGSPEAEITIRFDS